MTYNQTTASQEAGTIRSINLDHPRYGSWLRLAGVALLFSVLGISLIFVDLVNRMNLNTGVVVIDAALPFVLGISLGWTIAGAAIGIGVDRVRSQQQGASRKRSKRNASRPQDTWLSNGSKIEVAILMLGVVVAGVRVAKTMESQNADIRNVVAAEKKAYEIRLREWQASEDGREYARAKAQIRRLRTLGAQLLDDGRRLSHPKKRSDGASLLSAAEAVDLTSLEKTMPQPPVLSVVAPALPWWKFANIVIWPALLEFVATELLVLAVALWSSYAFAPMPGLDHADGNDDEEDE